MRTLWMLLILSTPLACSIGSYNDLLLPPPDVKSDVELFLATSDPIEESRILNRLERHQVSHEAVKSVLRGLEIPKSGPGGFQLDLQIDLDGKQYPYALYVPESAGPETSLPLIVILHGLGGNAENTLRTWVARLSGKFIVLCPSYPMGAWWTKRAEDLVLRLIRHTRANYPADPNRVFLAGLSNGAIGAYLIGMFYPDFFAGIVPIAGSITPRYMHFLVNLKNTPLYMIQGVKDPIFPIHLSRRVNKILTDMKYPVVYREHDETGMAHGGHFLPESEIPPMVEWLQKQKRLNFPPVIRMTREANHLDRIHWVRLIKGDRMAALQLPGPEKETVNVRDGKIATLFAVNKGNNEFELFGKDLLEYEIYLNTDMVDFNAPVRVTFQEIKEIGTRLVPGEKEVSFHKRVKMDMGVLLRGYKKNRDPNILFDARIKVSVGKASTLASLP